MEGSVDQFTKEGEESQKQDYQSIPASFRTLELH